MITDYNNVWRNDENQNIDQKVVNDFGEEWKKFDQNKGFTVEEKRHHFNDYFKIFPIKYFKRQ